MKTLSIDIETYSATNLAKAGVYKYSEDSDFEILLFGYSIDSGPVQVVDLAAGESLPEDVLSALTDPAVLKTAFNAQFERVCLSRFLGYPTGTYLDPASWHCTMVWAATLGLPLSLEGVGAVLGLEKQKLKEGKDLIRYFCTPAKTRDGDTYRHYPTDAPEKWALFKAYNLRDVETEMSIQERLANFPVAESEWRNYVLDQHINDRGIMLDLTLVSCTDGDAFLYHVEETVVSISSGGTVILTNDFMPVVPVITVTSETTLRWAIDGESFQKTVSAGTWEIPELELRHGNNTISVTGEGNVAFVYREGRL